ncbi:hypothetical protein EIP91_001166 [Steccherinum ochraceum]|uniref:Fungal-type protein kinase domain-containing protein n=1 Tax=Steccherinum ochraceum TaxID=92696 RepID=A0A4R0S131_9APHY|nr:hypothetical protein EIP91_001166 [Steccherinum ochraceum]
MPRTSSSGGPPSPNATPPASNDDAGGLPSVEGVSPEIMRLATSVALGYIVSPGPGKRKHGDATARGMNFADFGHTFCRLGEPGFTQVFDIVEHGLKLAAADSDDEDLDGLQPGDLRPAKTDEERIRDGSWRILCDGIPGFENAMISATAERALRRQVCTQLHKAIQDQRGNDTGGLKYALLDWIHFDTTQSLNPPISKQENSKSFRGWNHPVTAALLCPIEFEPIDDTYAGIKEGRITASAQQWPRFCYPDGHEYVPGQEIVGLFKGYLCVRSSKHIFMGPSSALKGPGLSSSRSPNAKRIGMTRMTPRALAYVLIQLWFALSSLQHWPGSEAAKSNGQEDDQFNIAVFWRNIVSFFDDGNGQDVLDFYDYEVFGIRRGGSNVVRERGTGAQSAMERIRAERSEEARKRARLDTEP